MVISYEIILTIVNLTNEETETFTKSFSDEINNLSDDKLYNNHHLLRSNTKMFNLFKREINSYCKENGITINNIDIDEFNINSLTDDIQVYFEPGDGDNPDQISLEPNIKCYIPPKYKPLPRPVLKGKAYDNTTIIWSWEDDGLAHYLVTENIDIANKQDQDKIIAQIPIGSNTYTETGLESNTAYTRRLISYDINRTSVASSPTTITTEVASIDKSLDQYKIDKNYDYTSDDSEREYIDEKLEAFHSGVGDYFDLKVFKQMDTDFFQKFKPYIQIRGIRTQREKCYDTVGFFYKVCLEGEETVEEQKGEVTFDIDLYPRENVTVKDYMFATKPVTICSRLQCDVLLKKRDAHKDPVPVNMMEPVWEKKKVPNKRAKMQMVSPLHLIICIDVTQSLPNMLKIKGYNSAVNAICKCVKKALKEINETIEDQGSKLKISIIPFQDYDHPLKSKEKIWKNYDDVKDQINASHLGNDKLTKTNWRYPLERVKAVINKNKNKEYKGEKYKNVVLFFSDGGPNAMKDNGSEYFYHGQQSSPGKDCYYREKEATKMVSYIDKEDLCDWINKHTHKVYCIVPVKDNNKALISGKPPQHYYKSYINKVAKKIANPNSCVVHWSNRKELAEQIEDDFIEELITQKPDPPYIDQNGNPTSEKYHYEGWEFVGWEDSDQQINVDVDWNIDDTKWARVIVPPLSEDPWMIEVNETNTPVVYARNERRAIIPEDHIMQDINFDPLDTTRMPGIKVDNRSIYDMIMESIYDTPEYQEGYEEVVHAYTEEEQKEGPYLIRNIGIRDDYMYDDEDEIPSVDPSQGTLEMGYAGSFNVYTNIDKMGSPEYGDDIYFAAQDRYVWASGYTDAIIYDGDRIVSTELNAYDRPTATIVASNGNYADQLTNRKNKAIVYNGDNTKIFHTIDVVLKDKDIYIANDSGQEELVFEGDWTLFIPQGINFTDANDFIRGTSFPVVKELAGAITAHNDIHFKSPILNYRFNRVDPNAYTSYYEILPGTDPDSPYQNIVALHIYYARNIFIRDKDIHTPATTKYIASFGDSNIATTSSPFYENSTLVEGLTLYRDDYIDTALWFEAKQMIETRPYYDEKPNEGMDSLYGAVNGRYGNTNRSGRKDLREETPQFNIPTTVDANNIRIYIMINEYNPEDALVSYKWDNPVEGQDGITRKNGDMVTFKSDTLTYKDVEYEDLVETITENSISVYDSKTSTYYFEIEKPDSVYTYDKYEIEMISDNSDVMILNYPKEIIFDENNRVQISADCKGVVNATTQWAPRIHNGYYYLNQHEYYAFSEFDVEADFVIDDEENYDTTGGYIVINVDLVKRATPTEHYDIVKNTRSELIQNEKEFEWIVGKGLVCKPVIDGQYYKKYEVKRYKSPVILFDNVLT